jgi:hypothetical protein
MSRHQNDEGPDDPIWIALTEAAALPNEAASGFACYWLLLPVELD